MVEQARILPMQKRNVDAIPKLLILHLRADLCCGQIWPRIKDSVIGAHFKSFLLTRPLSVDYCFGTN